MLAHRRARAYLTWLRRERGMSEVAAAIFILPLMFALVFTLIEVGINMRYRTIIDNTVADTLRGVAHDGAVYDARTYSGPREDGYRQAGQGWQRWGKDELAALCGDGNARCKRPPTLKCTPLALGAYSGQKATCTAQFWYRPVSGGLLDNPVFNLGFGSLWSGPITVTMTSVTTVGAGY